MRAQGARLRDRFCTQGAVVSIDQETRRMAREAAGAIRAANDQLASLHADLGSPFTEPKRVCGFCRGQPVGNAARWTDANASCYAACPRCGELNLPEGDEPTAEHGEQSR